MDLYITEKDTGRKVALCLLPDSVKTDASTNTILYNFISVGEVKIPHGQKLRQFSWSGVFPGESRRTMAFIKKQHWRAPKDMINHMETWRKKGTRLVLMLTETPLNVEVILSHFSHEWVGGCGDAQYSVEFLEAKDAVIYTLADARTRQSALNSNISNGTRPVGKTDTNTNSEQTKTYVVKNGDCLWNIAKKHLGSGAKYNQLFELNKKTIGNNPDLIKPGQVLILPY